MTTHGLPAAGAVALTVAVLGSTVLAGPAAARPGSLIVGFDLAGAPGRPDGPRWFPAAAAAGATTTRIVASWRRIATTEPPDASAATDPTWRGYDFTAADGLVRGAAQAGLTPVVTVGEAPDWAEGSGRSSKAPPGTWKPDAVAFGRFMTAIARRYSGTVPDPSAPGMDFPAVATFQIWNEPNLTTYLTPQWRGRALAAPALFRALQNAGYRGVKRAQPRAVVVTAGTSPYGDPRPGQDRVKPARFWRATLCLDDRLRRTCRATTSMDVVAHHPYVDGPPTERPRSVDDVALVNLGVIRRIAAAGVRGGTVLPRRVPPLWVTEYGAQSAPPARRGDAVASVDGQARWEATSQRLMWTQGAARSFHWSIVDSDLGFGLFTRDGEPKPVALAYRFPVEARRTGRSRLTVFVRSPVPGRAQLQVRRSGRWATVATFDARAARPRSLRIASSGVAAIRAVVGTETSYVWRVGG